MTTHDDLYGEGALDLARALHEFANCDAGRHTDLAKVIDMLVEDDEIQDLVKFVEHVSLWISSGPSEGPFDPHEDLPEPQPWGKRVVRDNPQA